MPIPKIFKDIFYDVFDYFFKDISIEFILTFLEFYDPVLSYYKFYFEMEYVDFLYDNNDLHYRYIHPFDAWLFHTPILIVYFLLFVKGYWTKVYLEQQLFKFRRSSLYFLDEQTNDRFYNIGKGYLLRYKKEKKKINNNKMCKHKLKYQYLKFKNFLNHLPGIYITILGWKYCDLKRKGIISPDVYHKQLHYKLPKVRVNLLRSYKIRPYKKPLKNENK